VACLFISSHARADNCQYSKNTYDQYMASCAQHDGCAYAQQMQKIVQDTCGPDSADGGSRSAASQATGGDQPDGPASSVSGQRKPPPPKPADQDYTGESCRYFTGASGVESDGAVTRLNYYAEGARVCHGDRVYVCEKSRWKSYGPCPAGVRQAVDVESRD
jgi:hypothetical protein